MTPWQEQVDEYLRATRTAGGDGASAPRIPPPSTNGHHRPDDGKPSIELTDLGNGIRFVYEHGQDLRYCDLLKSWFIWDERVWVKDDMMQVMTLAKQTIRKFYTWAQSEIGKLNNEAHGGDYEAAHRIAKIKKVLDWALTSQSNSHLEAVVKLARSEPNIGILPDALNANHWLLNVRNGIVDLRTGELRPHDRYAYCTRITPVGFDPRASCPRWMSFLDEVFERDPEMTEFIARAVGYSMTGSQDEQCFFFLHGDGCNGKSVFLSVIQWMLGPYASTGVSDLLTVRYGEQHPTELANLFGRRFVVLSETESGKKLAESRVKQLTGKEVITGRFMKKDFIEWMPTHHLWIAGNYKPKIVGADTGIWRRLMLIPFAVSFLGKQDSRLTEKLLQEGPGILAWAVRGCRDYQERGLNAPAQVLAAVNEYKSEEDRLGAWLTDRCVQGPEYRARSTELFGDYQQWAKRNGEHEITQTMWGREMTRKGFEKYANNGTWYKGVELMAIYQQRAEGFGDFSG